MSHQSFSTTGRPLAYLCNSATNAEICLVGTDHVTSKSVEHVRQAIRHYKPNVVAVEICKERADALLSGQQPKVLGWRDFFSMKGSFKERLLNCFTNSIYAKVVNEDGGTSAGAELQAAIEEGHALGANVLYMDKDIRVTTLNTSKELSLWKLLRFFLKREKMFEECYPKLNEAILKLEDAFDKHASGALSVRELREQFEVFFEPGVLEDALKAGEDHFPEVMKVFLHERNDHMVTYLRRLEGKVVAVVGAAHVPGICDRWQTAEVQVKQN